MSVYRSYGRRERNYKYGSQFLMGVSIVRRNHDNWSDPLSGWVARNCHEPNFPTTWTGKGRRRRRGHDGDLETCCFKFKVCNLTPCLFFSLRSVRQPVVICEHSAIELLPFGVPLKCLNEGL